MNKITRIAHFWFVFTIALITYDDGSKRLAVLFWRDRRHRYYLLVPPLRGEVVRAVRVREVD